MPYCMHLTVMKSSRLSPSDTCLIMSRHMWRCTFFFFLSLFLRTSCVKCSRRWVRFCTENDHKVLPVEVLEADPGKNTWGDVFDYTHYTLLSDSQKLKFMQVGNLLEERHIGSVKGESRNARQFISILYMLYRRSEMQWFLYFRSFSCPSTLASCYPGSVTSALLLFNPYPTR